MDANNHKTQRKKNCEREKVEWGIQERTQRKGRQEGKNKKKNQPQEAQDPRKGDVKKSGLTGGEGQEKGGRKTNSKVAKNKKLAESTGNRIRPRKKVVQSDGGGPKTPQRCRRVNSSPKLIKNEKESYVGKNLAESRVGVLPIPE